MTASEQHPSTAVEFARNRGLGLDGEHSHGRPMEKPARSGIAVLNHLSCLSVRGEDAESFLEGQLSAAVAGLGPSAALLTAWHDPKGRIRTLLHLWRDQAGFRLLMPSALVPLILPKLKMYILRAQVRIEVETDWLALGLKGSAPTEADGWHALTGSDGFYFRAGSAEDCARAWDSALALGLTAMGSREWRGLEMQAGIPAVPAGATELFLPQFLDLARFDGLNFRKGCYIGQEVIARTHYLGKVKQGLALATTDRAVAAGTVVRNAAERKIGHVLESVPDPVDPDQWLAQLVIRHDQADNPLSADDGPALVLHDAERSLS